MFVCLAYEVGVHSEILFEKILTEKKYFQLFLVSENRAIGDDSLRDEIEAMTLKSSTVFFKKMKSLISHRLTK